MVYYFTWQCPSICNLSLVRILSTRKQLTQLSQQNSWINYNFNMDLKLHMCLWIPNLIPYEATFPNLRYSWKYAPIMNTSEKPINWTGRWSSVWGSWEILLHLPDFWGVRLLNCFITVYFGSMCYHHHRVWRRILPPVPYLLVRKFILRHTVGFILINMLKLMRNMEIQWSPEHPDTFLWG